MLNNHVTFIRRVGTGAALIALLAACAHNPSAPTITQTASAQAVAAAYDHSLSVFHPVVAHNGMIASEHELASRVGLQILQAGGNAIDAAVAVGFALAVVLPNAGNIGGGGFMMYHDANTQQDVALDFRESAPAGAHRDLYLDSQGNVIDGKSLFTHYAVGVPGTVAGLEHALKKWGSLPLKQVIQPAIDLAENGFVVSETLAKVLAASEKDMAKWPATTAIFWRNGAPLKAGDRLVQKDLAQSLKLIANQGSYAFYKGDIARRIATEMQAYPGAITMADLARYQAIERQPVRGTYRGYDIVTMPPPSSGGPHLVQILNILERWPMGEWGHNSDQSIHHMAESMKLAYADRAEYLGDPDFVNVPVSGLISKHYADNLAQRINHKATPAQHIKPGNPLPFESDQTTHYSVMDKAGNAVAVTYTLNTNFGTGIVATGTGILLNNEMDDFSAKPGVANAYGLVGGEANSVQAGKRPLSSMTPTLVLKDGKPVLVTGSPGGARIITTVLQTVMNMIDYGMNPAESAAALRVHHQWTPDELRVEQGFNVDTKRLLEARGHAVNTKASMGRTQTIQRNAHALWGYSDPRNPDGLTLGY
ncbi:gamma-glutamyltransferase [Paenalcaligenes faecalis]|uniref:gamma-glutamyltransferase n=1 Tax=Paenalcaligenes faecalis TaxID=2980099 RepID=UPI0022B95023|nr:gamma-glutamyltransferase [Paenalcaligenes faecalis]